MPHVPGRDRGDPEAPDLVLHAGEGRNGGLHADRPRQARPERGGRVPARQPSARLPRLRQGRRVPPAGHLVRVGPRASRFVEPKRNFPKPIALSPLVAIDRERCILCYRCVRFSQEVAEDYQLAFLERADHTFVGTFDGGPTSRRSRATSSSCAPSARSPDRVPVPRAALGHRERGIGLHAVSEPVQHRLHGPRRADRARDRPRQRRRRRRLAVRQGAVGLSGGRTRERILEPLVRDGGAAAGDLGAGDGRRRGGAAQGRRGLRGARRRRDHERGGLPAPAHLPRGARLPHVDSRAGGRVDAGRGAALSHPDLAAPYPTSITPRACSWSRRTRSTRRRSWTCAAQGGAPLRRRLVVASSRPDSARRGRGEACARAGTARRSCGRSRRPCSNRGRQRPEDAPRPSDPRAARGDSEPTPTGSRPAQLARSSRSTRSSARRVAELEQDVRDAALLTAAENVVVIWGERLGHGERGRAALRRARRPRAGAGPRRRRRLRADRDADRHQRPRPARGRLHARLRARASRTARRGHDRRRERATPRSRRGQGLLPASRRPGARAAGGRALGRGARRAPRSWSRTSSSWARRPSGTRTSSSPPSPTPRRRAPSPTRTAASSAFARRSATRARCAPSGRCWSSWASCSGSSSTDHVSAGAVLAELAERSPLYRGVTLDEIGGRGVRWQEREASRAAAADVLGAARLRASPPSR